MEGGVKIQVPFRGSKDNEGGEKQNKTKYFWQQNTTMYYFRG
jgi:hypothetical protein